MTYRELKTALDNLADEQLELTATGYVAQGPNASIFPPCSFGWPSPSYTRRLPTNALALVGFGYPLLVGNGVRRAQ